MAERTWIGAYDENGLIIAAGDNRKDSIYEE